MNIEYGQGNSIYGPGVNIDLNGDEVETAISAYLVAHGVKISGPIVIRVNGKQCESGNVHVDPSGSVIFRGGCFSGRGPGEQEDTLGD